MINTSISYDDGLLKKMMNIVLELMTEKNLEV